MEDQRESKMKDLIDKFASKQHPFDLKNDEMVRIKMLFPENKALAALGGPKIPGQ
jgi:hypothetical protein